MKLKNIFTSCSSGTRSHRLHSQSQNRTTLPYPTDTHSTHLEHQMNSLHLNGHHEDDPRTNMSSSYSTTDSSSHLRPLSYYENCPRSELPPKPESHKNGKHWFQPGKPKNKRLLDNPTTRKTKNNNSSSNHRTQLSGELLGGSSGYLSSVGSDHSSNNGNSSHHRQFSKSKFYVDQETSRSSPALHNNGCSPCPSDDGLRIGDRVVWLREAPHGNEAGVVRWIGLIDNEEIAGIEFDRPLGLGSGWYRRKKLFECDPHRGGLVAVAGLILEGDYLYNPTPDSFTYGTSELVHHNNNTNSTTVVNNSSSPSPCSSNSRDTSCDYFPSPVVDSPEPQITSYHPSASSEGLLPPLPRSPFVSRGKKSVVDNNWPPSPSPLYEGRLLSPAARSPESSDDHWATCNHTLPSNSTLSTPVEQETDYSLEEKVGFPRQVGVFVNSHFQAGGSELFPAVHKEGPEEPNSFWDPTAHSTPNSNNNNGEKTVIQVYAGNSTGFGKNCTSEEVMPTTPPLQAPLREEDVERIDGCTKGIQGHRNSCYLDATLFSMFSFTGVFDSILLKDFKSRNGKLEDEKLAHEVQKTLRDDVVTSLRKNFFCPSDSVMKLRQLMQHLDDKLTSEEMDPQEFLQLLFKKVFNLDEFMPLSSGQSDFFHQVLIQQTDKDKMQLPTVQQLFEQSLMMQELKLKGVPTPALIIQMPRSGNKYKMYDGILPNLTIDITDLLEDVPRTCCVCGALATYECLQCYGVQLSKEPSLSGMDSTSFCEFCVNNFHAKRDRQSHRDKVTKINYPPEVTQYYPVTTQSGNSTFYQSCVSSPDSIGGFNASRNESIIGTTNKYTNRVIPRVKMDLFAVICIETSHFVSFVKCGTDRTAPWVFFDSMADRIENANGTGHNIPQVRMLKKMGTWLDMLEKNPDGIRSDSLAPDLKRLLSDPYICLYYSPEACMYS